MEQFKVLSTATTNRATSTALKPKRDKLEQTKKRERELKDAVKIKKAEEKALRQESVHAEQVVNRLERAHNPVSKRAAKDARVAEKRAERKEAGQTCEHGVWKCRICYPVTKHK